MAEENLEETNVIRNSPRAKEEVSDASSLPDATQPGVPLRLEPSLRPANREFPETLGSYRLVRKLGEGGMGVVYLAEDLSLHRQVALKVMRADLRSNFEAYERFLREARSVAAVKHDHIVTVYGVGDEQGFPFMAMELLRGISLEGYIRSGKTLSMKSILRLGREICRGLSAAHAKDLIHRDIKPANIWLEAPHGRVKILDFGLARPAKDPSHLTSTGLVMGTPHFMSPEQARGEKVDPRADLFSLGVLLYRIVTGKLPFDGPTVMAVLMSIGTQHPPAVATMKLDAPVKLSLLINRLLAKNKEDRPNSAEEVAIELAQIEKEHLKNPPSKEANGQPSPDTAMLIDDVLPASEDDEHVDNTANATEAIRPQSSRGRAKSKFDSIDEMPEIVEEQPKKKRKPKPKKESVPLAPFVVGGITLVIVVALLIGWKITKLVMTPAPEKQTTPPVTPVIKQSTPTKSSSEVQPENFPKELPPGNEPPPANRPPEIDNSVPFPMNPPKKEFPKFGDPPPKKDFPKFGEPPPKKDFREIR